MLRIMNIAIQGQIASFHDAAAHQFFGDDIELVCCDTFADTFAALSDGRAEFAMIAIENSLFGSINPVYDLLLKHHPWIFGETYLRIHQCLVGLPGSKLSDITEVYSHAAALAQCQDFLESQLPHAKHLEHVDTAGAVADVAAWRDPSKAAIASAAAAAAYGLKVLAADIETHHHNYTRFVALRPHPPTHPPARNHPVSVKTSIVLHTAHQSGALYHALGAFDQHHANLTLLTSRPIIGQHQKYRFYLDFEADSTSATDDILRQLHEQGCDVTVLGRYPPAPLPE